MANKIYNQDKIYAGNFSLNYFDGLNIGAITTFAGDTAPDGYLECDGSAVSRTTYAELFLVIGEKFGAGDGSASFNLPKIIDATAPTLKYLIKATTSGSAVNNATNTTRGFVRFATDSEAEFSVKDDVAINPKHLKLAVSKTDSKSKIYGTDSDGKQTLYNTSDFAKFTIITLPSGNSGTLTASQLATVKANPRFVIIVKDTMTLWNSYNQEGVISYSNVNANTDGVTIRCRTVTVTPSTGAWVYKNPDIQPK